MAQKWKIFTNNNRTKFVAARKGNLAAVYVGDSEVEALRAILDSTISIEVEPVEREWVDTLQPKETPWGKHYRVSNDNWHPSKYEDNKS